jgi:hypothetical protein
MTDKRNDKENEVIALGRWCSAVLEGFSQLGSNPTISAMQSVVSAATERKSVTQLKSIKRDLLEWLRGLSPAQQAAVLARAEENDQLAEEDEEIVVKRAISRGRIETDEEYETLRVWLDFAQDDEDRAHDVELVDALLTKFSTNV